MNKTLLVIFALVAAVSAVRFPIEPQSALEKAEPFLKKIKESAQKNKDVAEIVEKFVSNLLPQKSFKNTVSKLGEKKNEINEFQEEDVHLNDDSVLAGETTTEFKEPTPEEENSEEKQKDESKDEFKIKSRKNIENDEELDEDEIAPVEKKEKKIDLLNEKILADQEESDAMISYGLFDENAKNAENLEGSENSNEEDENEEKISEIDIIKYVDEIKKLIENLEKTDDEEEEEEEDPSNSNDEVMISYGLAEDLNNQDEIKALTDKEASEKISLEAILLAIKKFAAENGFNLHKQVEIEDNEKLRFDTTNDEDDDQLAGRNSGWHVESFDINKNEPSDDEDMKLVQSSGSEE